MPTISSGGRFQSSKHGVLLAQRSRISVRPRSVVLIVDDREPGRAALAGMLAGEPYDIVEACDGLEAVEKTLAVRPDVILLDVMLPELDGFEVCRRLRANLDFGSVPIVMVTALDDRESRLAGLDAGADDFISKPVNRLELRARVQIGRAHV